MNVVILLFTAFQVSLSAVTLTRNYEGNVCPNTEVVFTCTTDTGVLFWESGNDQQLFNSNNQDTFEVGIFDVEVVSVVDNTIISTATTTVVTNGTTIDCSDNLVSGNTETATIIEAVPPSEPLNFVNTTTTFSSVALSWDVPITLGGTNITHYLITVTPLPNTGSCPDTECRLEPSMTTTTITNLDYDTEYTFVIQAVNCADNGTQASLNVFINAEAPGRPQNLELCAILLDNGNELNLKTTWQCPEIDESIVPMISSYEIAVAASPSESITNYTAISDCRCNYSITVPVTIESQYSVTVSSVNSVGSNSESTTFAFRANLSSQLTLVSSSAAVVTVFISWQACPGVSADLSLQYNIMGSGSQQTVQPVTVSMPTDTVHIPVLNLESGRMYEYTIRLLSSGGVSLSDEERSSFLTEPEQQTECSSTAGSTSDGSVQSMTSGGSVSMTTSTSTTQSTAMTQPQATTVSDCPDTNTPLLIGIGIVGAVALTAFILFIIMCCLCIKASRKMRQGYLMEDVTHPSLVRHNYSNNVQKSELEMTKNVSYGKFGDSNNSTEDAYAQPYQELQTRSVVSPNPSYIETSTKSTDPLYVETDDDTGSYPPTLPERNNKEVNTLDVPNPAYGQTYLKVNEDTSKNKSNSLPIYEKIPGDK